MSLKIGIVGFPNVGKSTLFNALLKRQVAQSANYPFTTIEPNVGVVEVPDDRLNTLKEVVDASEGLAPSFKIVGATVNFVDIAGLVKGAHKGEGLGNQFLSHIREVDVICFVVRDFKSEDVVREGSTNSIEDLEILKSELMLKDLEVLEKRVGQMEREVKLLSPNDPKRAEFQAAEHAKNIVTQGEWLADVMEEEELWRIKEMFLLSAKKTIVVVNSDEEDLKSDPPIDGAIRISAKLEEELSGLTEQDQKSYLSELGIEEAGLNRLIEVAYKTLGLITFFTAGPKEVHAWTTQVGTLAPKAAGVIHTDFERGFIAAEVCDYQKYIDSGGWRSAKTKGLVKTIGKTEEVREGMIVEFRFSV